MREIWTPSDWHHRRHRYGTMRNIVLKPLRNESDSKGIDVIVWDGGGCHVIAPMGESESTAKTTL